MHQESDKLTPNLIDIEVYISYIHETLKKKTAMVIKMHPESPINLPVRTSFNIRYCERIH